MPYAFTARSWESIGYESIDILDALASSIRLDIINNNIVRTVPSTDESLNEEWITNKARFFYDSLNMQRLIYPRLLVANKFIKFSWHKIFSSIVHALKSFQYTFIGAYCGPFTSLEGSLALKSYLISMGCSNIYYTNNYPLLTDSRLYYRLNDTLLNLEEEKDNILFFGTNIRSEAPLINSRLRKNFLNNIEFKAYSMGSAIIILHTLFKI